MEPGRYASTEFGRAGRTIGPHGYVAYFPAPIPRTVALAGPTIRRLADAEAALGRLAGAGRLLPNPHLLVRPYLRPVASRDPISRRDRLPFRRRGDAGRGAAGRVPR